jgi:hypothetical protein
MRTPIFRGAGLILALLLPASPILAQNDTNRKTFRCVGAWDGAVPVTIEVADGKVLQNGEVMQEASIGPDKISYKKRDGADLFVTTVTPSSGRLTISVFQSPRKEERAFLEGKCKVAP